MLVYGIALSQTNGERLNHMKIYPTYTSGNWIDGTIIIDGIKEYYAGSKKCIRRLTVIPPRCLLDAIARVKPYENTLHVHEA